MRGGIGSHRGDEDPVRAEDPGLDPECEGGSSQRDGAVRANTVRHRDRLDGESWQIRGLVSSLLPQLAASWKVAGGGRGDAISAGLAPVMLSAAVDDAIEMCGDDGELGWGAGTDRIETQMAERVTLLSAH